MVVYYDILGQRIGSHYLAMGVLGSIFGGVFLATGGSKKPLIHQTPPFNAKDKNEEDFIQNFLKESEGAQKAAKH
ncbi:uncharacterized protein K489DRAFT_413334 [Dissoconium aciculare CBS 342.82]|uniref:ATP synthase subunit K, mitochondrial n=1 Tax=Dissoconium aciculare CBS 342.82 TaxID=1314786 RepID=A0A6J3LW73_9PEZI|nr:uncharacterized protein K489DRAFT_413334 [Dissoconium aciculare CBS 342.82]KAF1818882.1 hypothetical protein K489DRAFT_413334 [Dissoconium aciculare CBS 342.82]